MSRIISLIVGIYTGLVVDQNFEVPRVPMPSTIIEKAKEHWQNFTSDDKGKDK